jgi:cardiolipin synthase
MLDAIDGARDEVLLEMYLVESGQTADRFIAALGRAVARGVRVCVLLDAFGARGLRSVDRVRLTAAGVQLAFYNPIHFRNWRRSLFRNHRKLLLVDGQVAFVGGMGITEAFDPIVSATGSHWHDAMLAVEGPCALDWRALFGHAWQQWHGQVLPPRLPAVAEAPTRADGQVVGYIRGGGQPVLRAVLARIAKARQRVWIATAYFAPTRRLRRALQRAARRGVDVRLLLTGSQTDHPTVWHAGRRFYGRLLDAGVRIFEFQPRFLHAKLVLCDDWASIGSSNLDHWALRWNLEANHAVLAPEFAAQVKALFEQDFAASDEIAAAAWQSRSGRQRLMERLLGSLADSLVQWSYRRRLRQPADGQGR